MRADYRIKGPQMTESGSPMQKSSPYQTLQGSNLELLREQTIVDIILRCTPLEKPVRQIK